MFAELEKVQLNFFSNSTTRQFLSHLLTKGTLHDIEYLKVQLDGRSGGVEWRGVALGVKDGVVVCGKGGVECGDVVQKKGALRVSPAHLGGAVAGLVLGPGGA